MIAIDADYTTDFKFHSTRGCCCFTSHNDDSQVAKRNVSIIAYTRHRNPYLPQPDCCCCVPFLTTTSLSLSLSPSPPHITTVRFYGRRTERRASVHRPTRLLLLCFNSHNVVDSGELIHGRRTALCVCPCPNHRYDSLNIYKLLLVTRKEIILFVILLRIL